MAPSGPRWPASSARNRRRWSRRSWTAWRATPIRPSTSSLGGKTFKASLKDIIYDAPKGDFPHPNTMTCKLMAGDQVLLEQEYYSVGGGFIEWKGYEPPKKGQPKYPYSTMKELQAHAEKNKLSIAQVVMANEVAVSGKSEAEIGAFVAQDSHGDGQHRQGRTRGAGSDAAGPDQAEDQGRRRLQARPGREVRRPARRGRRRRRMPWPDPRRMRAGTSSSRHRPEGRPA